MYENYAKKLKDFGVCFVDRVEKKVEKSKKTTVITASFMIEYSKSTIKIDKSTIVTPLAYDIAREKNIRILRNEQIC